MSANNLPTFEKKNIFSRSAHQATRDKANKADNIQVEGDLSLEETSVSKTLSHFDPPSAFIRALAVIIAPEKAAYTYTNPRYRCRIQKIIYGTSYEDIVKLANHDDPTYQPEGGTAPNESVSVPIGWTVTATNLVEITDPATGAGTHTMPENGTRVVEITGYYDRVDGQPSRLRWVFNSGATGSKGQYQHQANVMVSDNQEGWDAPRAHETLPNPI